MSLVKCVEQIVRIVRTRRGFRVVLHAEDGVIPEAETFERLVVQIHMGNLNVTGGQRIRIDAKPMILRRNFHLVRQQILHRMIGSVVAKLELECFATECESAKLVPEANAENRHSSRELANL